MTDYFDPDRKFFHIGNKTFRVKKMTQKKKSVHASKDILVEVDMAKYDERIDKIAEYLETTMDKKKFLKSILDTLPLSHIEKIERRMQKKAVVKEFHGCYNLIIGNVEIPLSE